MHLPKKKLIVNYGMGKHLRFYERTLEVIRLYSLPRSYLDINHVITVLYRFMVTTGVAGSWPWFL